MNVEFANIETLVKALHRLKSSVPVKDTHAVSIQAEEEGLVMWRSNSEEYAEIRVGCVVHQTGALALADPAALDIARGSGELVKEGDNVEFHGQPRMMLRTASLGFERWNIPEEGWRKFETEALKVYWANDPIGLGKGLGYLVVSGRYVAATNRFVMCWWKLDKPLFEQPVMFEPDRLVRGLLSEQAEVCLAKGKIWFREPDFVYGRALTAANDWTGMIQTYEAGLKKGNNTTVRLHRETLLTKLKNVKHLSSNKTYTDGRCYVTLDSDELVIEGMATEAGQITERMEVDNVCGPAELGISLSPGQLVPAVEVVTKPVVSLVLVRSEQKYVMVIGGHICTNSGMFYDNWRKVA